MHNSPASNTRRLLSLLLLAGMPGCDDTDDVPGVVAENAIDPPVESAIAEIECPAGSHLVVADDELEDDAPPIRCEADASCSALDCGAGACLKEAGYAACVCPPGYEGLACDTCASGYVRDDAGQCSARAAAEAPASLLAPDGPMLAASVDGHRVEHVTCGGGSACPDEIPMTGRVSDLFEEVDMAMAQFMKTRCAGSGVVSFSRGNRRVYKRGFGKTRGSAAPNLAHCPEDAGNYQATAPHTLPDTPHQTGSVAKFVTAAMVREQVWSRIQQRGLLWKYDNPTEALLLDPDLELLPPALLRYFDQTRSDAVCPPITSGTCARSGCGGNGPDARWQQMTVGDLIGHTAGLASGVMPSWESIIVDADLLRGYDSRNDWVAEHEELRSRTKYPASMDAARSYLAGRVGASSHHDIFFVSNYDALDGEDLLDETLKVTAGRCLSATPQGQSDGSPSAANQGYQNGAYALLGRISAHLNGETGGDPLYSSPNGFPELHEGSALDTFLMQHGLEDGVIAEHSIQSRVTGSSPGRTDPVPDRRAWDGETYIPREAAKNRPFCVWSGNTCSFNAWANDTDNATGVRLRWDFGIGYWDFSGLNWINRPRSIEYYYNTEARNPSTGGLMMEAPALLRLSNLYRAESMDVHQGSWRNSCTTDCDGTSQKGGDMGGARGRVRQMAGGSPNVPMPPRTPSGRLQLEPDTTNWSSATWDEPDEVDLVVAVSQSEDEEPNSSYNMEQYVSYGMSRVDWDAVDLMLERQAIRVAGMAFNSSSRTYLWWEDDHRTVHSGLPYALGHETTSPADVTFPSSRNATDVVGISIAPGGGVYTWYDDGHRSRGNSWNLDAHDDVVAYSLPPGQTYEDIVGISIAADSRVYSWYADGTRAIGTSWDLDAHGVGSYSLPPGQTAGEIEGIAIDWAGDSHTYTRFRDGSVTEGRTWNLDAYRYVRGSIAGMSMHGGDTTLWFRNGYMRRMQGSPADNMDIPTILEAGEYAVAPGKEPSDVVGVAEIDGGGVRFWYDDETTSWNDNDAVAVEYPSYFSARVSTLAGIARTTDGRVYSWYTSTPRAVGTIHDLDAESTNTSFQSPQDPFALVAVAIDSSAGGDGRVWSIYSDGAVGRGRSWNLGQQYWPAP
jgi:hypothetical protein